MITKHFLSLPPMPSQCKSLPGCKKLCFPFAVGPEATRHTPTVGAATRSSRCETRAVERGQAQANAKLEGFYEAQVSEVRCRYVRLKVTALQPTSISGSQTGTKPGRGWVHGATLI